MPNGTAELFIRSLHVFLDHGATVDQDFPIGRHVEIKGVCSWFVGLRFSVLRVIDHILTSCNMRDLELREKMIEAGAQDRVIGVILQDVSRTPTRTISIHDAGQQEELGRAFTCHISKVNTESRFSKEDLERLPEIKELVDLCSHIMEQN